MAVQFTALEATFDGNAKPFMKAANKVEKKSFSMARSFGRAVKSIAGFFVRLTKRMAKISLGLGAIAVALAKMAASAIDARNKFRVVFSAIATEVRQVGGKTTLVLTKKILPGIQKFIETTSKAFQLPTIELMKWTSQLQDTLFPMLQNREQASKMSEDLTKLAMDFSSFYNVSTEDAIGSITSALVGNHEAVRKFGITITEAELENEAFRKGLNKSSQEMSVQEKLMMRLALIYRGSSDAQGDFARTAREGSNTFRTLWFNIKDFGRAIGEIFLPAVEKSNARLTQLLFNLTQWIREGIGLGEMFSRLKNVMLFDLEILAKNFSIWLTDLGLDPAWQTVLGAWDKVKEVAVAAWDVIIEKTSEVRKTIGEWKDALAEITWEDIETAASKTFNKIKQLLQETIGEIVSLAKELRAAFDTEAIIADYKKSAREMFDPFSKARQEFLQPPSELFRGPPGPLQLPPESITGRGLSPQTNISINVEADPERIAQKIAALLKRQGDTLGLGEVTVEGGFA